MSQIITKKTQKLLDKAVYCMTYYGGKKKKGDFEKMEFGVDIMGHIQIKSFVSTPDFQKLMEEFQSVVYSDSDKCIVVYDL